MIKVIEAADENELARYACRVGADAEISTFTQDEVTSTTVGGGPYLMTGRSRTRTEANFVGRAIKFEPEPSRAHEPLPVLVL